jgi:hypothetical protein
VTAATNSDHCHKRLGKSDYDRHDERTTASNLGCGIDGCGTNDCDTNNYDTKRNTDNMMIKITTTTKKMTMTVMLMNIWPRSRSSRTKATTAVARTEPT